MSYGTTLAFASGDSLTGPNTVSKSINRNLIRLIRLTHEMMLLADRGDENRRDAGCGVIYGTLRDNAYKLRSLAEKEIEIHKQAGLWDPDDAEIG